MSRPPVLNLSAYRFVPLAELPALRDHLHASAAAHRLRGTVLLAEEGINLSMAGAEGDARAWWQVLTQDPRFAGLRAKESFSATLPFRRLKVKTKAEIIRMNQPAIRPAAQRAPAVAPLDLARWLQQGHDDSGRPVVMLDTRNGFEVDAGAFDQAIDWRLHQFSDFPAALSAHREALQGHTVVSYCTGGIRCEKAAIVMQQMGVANSAQLEGGILGYFEATQGRAPGWHGECFVFDERQGLDPALQAAAPPEGADARWAETAAGRRVAQ